MRRWPCGRTPNPCAPCPLHTLLSTLSQASGCEGEPPASSTPHPPARPAGGPSAAGRAWQPTDRRQQAPLERRQSHRQLQNACPGRAELGRCPGDPRRHGRQAQAVWGGWMMPAAALEGAEAPATAPPALLSCRRRRSLRPRRPSPPLPLFSTAAAALAAAALCGTRAYSSDIAIRGLDALKSGPGGRSSGALRVGRAESRPLLRAALLFVVSRRLAVR